MAIKTLNSQIERAAREKKEIIIIGDVNLDANKWLDSGYPAYNIAVELTGTLAQCGIEIEDVGNTYLADRLAAGGVAIESAIDHVYISANLRPNTKTVKLNTSSTDHLPITVKVKYASKKKEKIVIKKRKRSMKNFTQEKWLQHLAGKNWEAIGETENIEEMAKKFSGLMNEALDELAPIKNVSIRPGYIVGLSVNTKKLMHERDLARKKVCSSAGERLIAMKKYKMLRNKVTHQISESLFLGF